MELNFRCVKVKDQLNGEILIFLVLNFIPIKSIETLIIITNFQREFSRGNCTLKWGSYIQSSTIKMIGNLIPFSEQIQSKYHFNVLIMINILFHMYIESEYLL